MTKTLDRTGQYPNFNHFVAFVTGEAKVACNPVSSLYTMTDERKSQREAKRKLAIVLTTNADLHRERVSYKETTKKCVFCNAGHDLPLCRSLAEKSLKEKHQLIQEQRRCFGCLRVGHGSKNCKGKHTC